MDSRTARKGLTTIDGAIGLIVVLLVVQVWLLTATLESCLAGHQGVVLPALLFSALLVAACVGLYAFVRRIDGEVRRLRR